MEDEADKSLGETGGLVKKKHLKISLKDKLNETLKDELARVFENKS